MVSCLQSGVRSPSNHHKAMLTGTNGSHSCSHAPDEKVDISTFKPLNDSTHNGDLPSMSDSTRPNGGTASGADSSAAGSEDSNMDSCEKLLGPYSASEGEEVKIPDGTVSPGSNSSEVTTML